MHYSIILLHQRFYQCTLNDSKIPRVDTVNDTPGPTMQKGPHPF